MPCSSTLLSWIFQERLSYILRAMMVDDETECIRSPKTSSLYMSFFP